VAFIQNLSHQNGQLNLFVFCQSGLRLYCRFPYKRKSPQNPLLTLDFEQLNIVFYRQYYQNTDFSVQSRELRHLPHNQVMLGEQVHCLTFRIKQVVIDRQSVIAVE
jgi:hypothetical protein